MIIIETQLKGAFLLEIERLEDDRGFFARTWCRRELDVHGLNTDVAQCSLSFNRSKGTLRGLHFQSPPYEEVKLVRCIRGAIHDVIVDLRPESPTYLQHVAVELSAENRRALYVPKGLAHGFQTLVDDTEVLYQISEFHAPDFARGVRWDDPVFGIQWPPGPRIISPRDQSYPDFVPAGSATFN